MKAERRGFIFARVGVRIAGHHRFLRIPAPKRAAALGIWLAALTFSRAEQLDGFCPLEAIQAIAPRDIIDRLVDVGLFTRQEENGIHGVWVLKYDDFNDTKAEIDAAREKERRRKSETRSSGRPPSLPPVVPPDNSRESRGSPSSSSLSVSGSPIGEGDREGSTAEQPSNTRVKVLGAPKRYIEPGDAITGELREAAKMATVQDVDAAWLKFCGKYAGQWRHVAGAWQAFCVSWAKVERTERERERERAKAAGGPLTLDGLDPQSFEAAQERKRKAKAKADAEAADIAAKYAAKGKVGGA
jgi:hypothetical protein